MPLREILDTPCNVRNFPEGGGNRNQMLLMSYFPDFSVETVVVVVFYFVWNNLIKRCNSKNSKMEMDCLSAIGTARFLCVISFKKKNVKT